MHHCPTVEARVVVALKCNDGIVRMHVDAEGEAGFAFTPKPLLAIAPQISEVLAAKWPQLQFDLKHNYSDSYPTKDGNLATMYLVMVRENHDPGHLSGRWQAIPELLRRMNADRGRLPVLRVWQVILGGLEGGEAGTVKAVDLDVALKHLKVEQDPNRH